jgi:flagellar M-ring protein FliF
VLAGVGDDVAEMAAGDQFGYRQKVEAYLSRKAETMLAKVVGNGRCEVRVSAELAFENSRETRREYDPEKKVLVSEQIETSKSSGGAGEVGGTVGTTANVPGEGEGVAVGGPAPSQQSKTENITTEYMVSESVRETVNRGAIIKRLTVAAFVDLPEPEQGGEEGTEQSPAVAVPTLEDIERVVKDAIGFDEARGDSLKIVEADLQPAVPGVAATAAKATPAWVRASAEYFAIGVLGFVLWFLGRGILKALGSGKGGYVVTPEVVGPEGEGAYQPSTGSDDSVRRHVAELVQSNPEAASRMLEGWVEGEE